MHTKPSSSQIVAALLKQYGRTFSEDLQVNVESNTPSALFAALVAALLFSARISHGIALQSARVLLDRGWTNPKKLAESSWEARVKALDEGGYARYDGRTATMLGETAQMITNLYQGDLRNLRQAAGANPSRERSLLKQFKGIGDVGVDIFFREVQLVWPELYPFADKKTLAGAKALGLPVNLNVLSKLIRTRREFARLVDALVRVQLERKQDEVLAKAAALRAA